MRLYIPQEMAKANQTSERTAPRSQIIVKKKNPSNYGAEGQIVKRAGEGPGLTRSDATEVSGRRSREGRIIWGRPQNFALLLFRCGSRANLVEAA